jgi:hypothetical protein
MMVKCIFEELRGDEKQQNTWKDNRASAYYGSMNHFLRALYAGTTATEGFQIYKIADSELRQSVAFGGGGGVMARGAVVPRATGTTVGLQPFNPDSLVKSLDINRKLLQLSLEVKDGDTSRLYICYTRKREPSRFYTSTSHLNIAVPNAQISSIYPVAQGNIVLSRDGSLSPGNSVVLQGYWAWGRVADLLPGEVQSVLEANTAKTAVKEIELLAKSAPVEKIHIQMDRPWYLTGDTAWMKVYVVDTYNKPSADSKVCFVELIDGSKHIVKNLRLPLNAGIAWGEIALNDSLIKKGTYMLRVYTNNTQKNGNAFFYKTFPIADLSSALTKSKRITPTQKQSSVSDSLKLQFFPEGGIMVTDVNSRIAVKISAFSKAVDKMPGYIANEVGSHIAKFETNKSGVSTFNLKPLKEGKYWAVLTLPNGQEKRFALPQAQLAGVNMAVKQNDEDIIVYLNAANLSGQTPLNLSIKTDGRLQYQAEKLLTTTADSIVISKTELPEGLLQFYLSTAGNTVAERMVYNQSNRQLNIKLQPNKPRYKPHDKVDINIAVTDTEGRPVSGNFSVTVNNEADLAGGDLNEKNILSNLLLGGRLKDGESILNRDVAKLNADTQHELDDLLLTVNTQNGKKQILAQQPSPSLPQDTSSAVRGQIFTAKGKPAASSLVGLFFPLGGPVLTAFSDNNGRFTFNSVPVKRGDPFYIVAKDKAKDLIATVDKYEPPVITDEVMADTLSSDDIDFDYIAKRIGELTTGNILGTELKEVLVKDKKKAEPTIKELVKQRSSNLGGTPDQVLTFIDLLDCNYTTLGGCLALKLHNIAVVDDTILHRPKLIARGRSDQPMAIFVDGVERMEALYTLSASNVASVEVLKGSNAAAYGLRSGGGVVIITTKNGDLDYAGYEQEHYAPGSTKTSPVKRYRFENSFDTAREFYAPNYTTTSANIIDKWRPTMYWNPNVITGTDGKAQVSYFTNSAPGTYRVTIEGIDDYGRIARQVFKYTVSE